MTRNKLHYAKLETQGDIPCYELIGMKQVRNFVAQILDQHPTGTAENMVYLVAIQDDVFVTQNCQFITELFDCKLNSVYPFFENENIFIQEYSSYEEAYRVALDIKEEINICYNN